MIDYQAIFAQATVQFPEAPDRVPPTERPQGLLHRLVITPLRHGVAAAAGETHQGTRPALALALVYKVLRCLT